MLFYHIVKCLNHELKQRWTMIRSEGDLLKGWTFIRYGTDPWFDKSMNYDSFRRMNPDLLKCWTIILHEVDLLFAKSMNHDFVKG